MNKAEAEKSFARRLKIVGVFGGSKPCDPSLEVPLGQLIDRKGFHLLTGGGGGVMAQVSEAFYKTQPRIGLVLGIIRAGIAYDPALRGQQRPYEPNAVNDWLEVPIYTHLQLSGTRGKELASRNPINVLSSDVAIVLPGSDGTGSEVELALEYGTPVIFYLGGGKIGINSPHDYMARYPRSRALDARDLGEVEAELDRLLGLDIQSREGSAK
jgi:predicted Rossmann-fold nucleotide-binding protein